MATRRSRGTPAMLLPMKAAELAIAAPQVIARRLTQMAVAGANPTARDQREFKQMGAEKVVAFSEAAMAMGASALRSQQAFATAMLRNAWMPWLYANPLQPKRASKTLFDDSVRMMSMGLAPIHRKAVANAKRLNKAGATPAKKKR